MAIYITTVKDWDQSLIIYIDNRSTPSVCKLWIINTVGFEKWLFSTKPGSIIYMWIVIINYWRSFIIFWLLFSLTYSTMAFTYVFGIYSHVTSTIFNFSIAGTQLFKEMIILLMSILNNLFDWSKDIEWIVITGAQVQGHCINQIKNWKKWYCFAFK